MKDAGCDCIYCRLGYIRTPVPPEEFQAFLALVKKHQAIAEAKTAIANAERLKGERRERAAAA